MHTSFTAKEDGMDYEQDDLAPEPEDFEETRFPVLDMAEAKRLAAWFLEGVPSLGEFEGVVV